MRNLVIQTPLLVFPFRTTKSMSYPEILAKSGGGAVEITKLRKYLHNWHRPGQVKRLHGATWRKPTVSLDNLERTATKEFIFKTKLGVQSI